MAEHLTTEQLLLACDHEAGEEAESHLSGCEECRLRLAEIRDGVEDYAAYHRSALRQSMPPPPRVWRDLPVRRPARAPYYWMALAAALVIGVVALWTSRQTAPVLEPTALLSKAEALERPSSDARTILVRSSRGKLIRPAVWVHTSRHPLQARFERAGYNWDEPLSVRSYVAWRRTLTRKQDTVTHARNNYVVTTSTDANPVRVATLTLREQDLRPVACTLRFDDNEVVEMEEGGAPVVPSPAVAPSPIVAPTVTTSVQPAMLELEVLVALHSVGADLGEPIQMEHDNGKIVLSATGISSTRREQIQRALAGLDFVVPKFDSPRSSPPSTALRTESSTQNQNVALRALVEQHLQGGMGFEQFVNDSLDASDALSSRAHALAALAARFSEQTELGLPVPGRQLLESLRRDHIQKSTEQVQRLAGLLLNGFGIEGAAANPASGTWQIDAVRFRDSVQSFDTLLTGVLTGSRKAEVAPLRDAFLRMKAEFEALAGIP